MNLVSCCYNMISGEDVFRKNVKQEWIKDWMDADCKVEGGIEVVSRITGKMLEEYIWSERKSSNGTTGGDNQVETEYFLLGTQLTGLDEETNFKLIRNWAQMKI